MLKIKFYGFEIGATGHDLTKNQFNLLKKDTVNLKNIVNVLEEYDIWSTNYFNISRPIIDDSLIIEVTDQEQNLIWSGTIDEICDIYEHADKFPVIEKIELYDEPNQNGDAVAWEEHPYILYYEELNKGLVGVCSLETKSFNPGHLSIVEGCLETDETEWIYINKIYYEGAPLALEPLIEEPKNKYGKFRLIS